jgi:hypothetical protein
MHRTLALAAVVAAFAVPAFAGDIHVSLVGKTPAEIKKDIHRAATNVCLSEGYTLFTEHLTCVSEVENQALAAAYGTGR